MNIRDNNEHTVIDDVQNAEVIMEACMDTLLDLAIKPMSKNFNDEEVEVIALIGETLKLIASKAKRYEDMMEGETFSKNFLN